MTFTAVLLPILAALSVAQDKLPRAEWEPTNSEQRLLMDRYYSKRHELQKLLPKELRSCAAFGPAGVKEVNHFLKENGFDIELDANVSPIALAVASILDIALSWKVEGKKDSLIIKKNGLEVSYSAVRMEEGYVIRKLSSGNHVLAIGAKNGDTVYMTIADRLLGGFELFEHVQTLSSLKHENVTASFSHAIFPMVDINQEVDITWLMELAYGAYSIDQALQQTKFQMDEKGAAVQSAVAIVLNESCSCSPVFMINKPFYLWIERPGMSLPLFAAYVDFADWKQPSR